MNLFEITILTILSITSVTFGGQRSDHSLKAPIFGSCRVLLESKSISPNYKVRFGSGKIGINKEGKYAFSIQTPKKWNGKTALLLSGMGRNMRFFDSHTKGFLQQGYRVLRVEQNNEGESLIANEGDVGSVSLEDDAELVANTIEELGVSKNLYIIGHSRGAAVAILAGVALERRGIIPNGILASNPYVIWLTDFYREQNRKTNRAIMSAWSIFNPFAYHPFTAGLVRETGNAWADNITDITIAGAEAMTALSDLAQKALDSRLPQELEFNANKEITRAEERDALVKVLEAMRGKNIFTEIGELKAPLSLVSSKSVLEPAELMDQARAHVQNPGLIYMKESGGHLFPLTMFDRFMEIAFEFLGSP